jgi:hypothetical protein
MTGYYLGLEWRRWKRTSPATSHRQGPFSGAGVALATFKTVGDDWNQDGHNKIAVETSGKIEISSM